MILRVILNMLDGVLLIITRQGNCVCNVLGTNISFYNNMLRIGIKMLDKSYFSSIFFIDLEKSLMIS